MSTDPSSQNLSPAQRGIRNPAADQVLARCTLSAVQRRAVHPPIVLDTRLQRPIIPMRSPVSPPELPTKIGLFHSSFNLPLSSIPARKSAHFVSIRKPGELRSTE